MKIAYVIGPYRDATHDGVYWKIQRARLVATRLWSLGFAVICPHTNSSFMSGTADEEFFMRGYIEMISRVDLCVVVHGYEDSEGSKAEIEEAGRHGIPVCYLCDGKTGFHVIEIGTGKEVEA